jgi:hypothetical protein
MKFLNQTPLPAALLKTTIDGERIAASVVARATFDLSGAVPALATEQTWQVDPEPMSTPYGPMEGDGVFRRDGVDIFLFGTAWTPDGRPATASAVELRVGAFHRRLVVTGDRVWQSRASGTIAPSAPRPFTSMPLTLARAFGGTTIWDGLEQPHPDNPKGLGYYLTAADATDRPLPNIEEADAPVRSWSDRPDPAGLGFCPAHSQLRLKEAFILEEHGLPIRITRRLFNLAFPRMVAPSVQPGDVVSIRGVRAAGSLELRVPDLPVLARIRLGDNEFTQRAAIDQIGFEPDENRMFVSYRIPFRFVVTPRQLRSCELAFAS